MKRKILSVVLAVIFMFALASCGASDPKGVVDSYMKACQKLDTEKMYEYFPGQGASIENDALGESDIDFFSRITYELGETSVDGDKATQKIQITTVDMTTIMTELVTELTAEMLTNLGDSEFDSEAYVNELLAEKLSNPDAKLITTTVTVNLEKNSDGKWIISSPDQNAEFLDALSGGIVNSLTTMLGSLFE